MLGESIFRRWKALRAGKSSSDVRSTFVESLPIAQVEPSGLEMTRAGRRFALGNSAAVAGVAPATSLQTTGASWGIYNADPVKSYFFETLGCFMSAVSTNAPGVGGLLMACIYQTPAITGAQYAGISVTSLSDANGSTSKSRAIVKNAQTITTPAAPNWFPIAENPSPNVTAAGFESWVNRDVRGRLAIQPGWALGLYVLAPAGTNSPVFTPIAEWVEVETDME